MRISLVTPPSQNIEPLIEIFRSKGVKVDHNSIHPKADFILMTTQVWINLVDQFHNMFPQIPIVSYVLDFYKTVWAAPNPHGYNWQMYKYYINKATEVWGLSNEVLLRLEEEGINRNKCRVIKIHARFFDYDGPITDKRYILKLIRPYVADKNYGWLERACGELDIPLIIPNHNLSEQEYRKIIAECSFMCCDYHETSTGGLGLLEGYNLGKLSVISNSLYQGAQDYLKENAIYFDDNSYEDFKRVIKETWENTPQTNLKECQAFCTAHPTKEDVVDSMIERLKFIKENNNVEKED